MNLFNKFKSKFQSQLLKRLRLFKLDMRRTQDIDMQLVKLKSIKDPIKGLSFSEQLVNEYPNNPKAHLNFAFYLHKMGDIRQFDQMNKYALILRDWIGNNGTSEISEMEFIWSGMVTGSFGNHYAVEGLLRANKYGLRIDKKPYLLLPKNSKLRNPALFSYFEPYINVIRDQEMIDALRGLEALLTIPLGIHLPINEKSPFLDIAANMCEVQRIKLGEDAALFHLNQKHQNLGKEALKKLGLPVDAWYVTLHVREPGYRGETLQNTDEDWRNANPLDYVNACKAVTKAGGWVFRMGDPSMTIFPELPNVIDYAHFEEIRSDWMDVFLGATCRFLISTASGYQRVPGYFGVPSIYTNCTSSVPYFSIFKNDLYLPRLLKYKNNNKYVSFEELMSPPLSMLDSTKQFLEMGLEWIENTPEELEAATIEMLEKTDINISSKSDDSLQQRFKIMAERCGPKYGGHSVKALASVSREFLHRHVDLLEEEN